MKKTELRVKYNSDTIKLDYVEYHSVDGGHLKICDSHANVVFNDEGDGYYNLPVAVCLANDFKMHRILRDALKEHGAGAEIGVGFFDDLLAYGLELAALERKMK